jgi:N-acyl-D-amino-acid deacylase
VRLHISHLKAIGERNQVKIDQVLQLIEKHNLSFDSYPYPYGSTSLLSVLPPQLFDGTSVQDGLERLSDQRVRREINAILSGETPAPAGLPWDNLALLVGWDKIELVFIPDGPDADLIGRSMASAAERRRTSPSELTLRLCRTYGGQIRIIDDYSREETVRKRLNHPSGIVSSDTLLGGHQHPRVAGTFPRVLSKYTYRRTDGHHAPDHASGSLGLEEAVHRMSGRSAQFLGIKDRGILSRGMFADIAVWRPDFTDTSSRRAPEQPARGLKYLFVNGSLVINDSEIDAPHTAGRLLTAPDYILPQTAER